MHWIIWKVIVTYEMDTSEHVTCEKQEVPAAIPNLEFVGINIPQDVCRPDKRFNSIYGLHTPGLEGFKNTFFTEPLQYGPNPENLLPYHCPNGWRRFSLCVAKDAADFEVEFGNWYVGYHGTANSNIASILSTGFRSAEVTCHRKEGEDVVYFSPSIVYASHPRYAKVFKMNDSIVQVVLMCRVNQDSILRIAGGTLVGTNAGDPRCDVNHSNESLEWLVDRKRPSGTELRVRKDMLRCGLDQGNPADQYGSGRDRMETGYKLKEGSKVDCNFREQGKWYSAKVVRVNSDGTFDIIYDVGWIIYGIMVRVLPPVRIGGVVGVRASQVNGTFEPSEDWKGGMLVYGKQGDASICLEYSPAAKQWQVKCTRSGNVWAVLPSGHPLPPQKVVGSVWQVLHGTALRQQPAATTS